MRSRWRVLLDRLRRFEQRELRELRQWLAQTSNLVHLSILLLVPLVIGLVTMLANAVGALSFLLYPPLASGAYTLFANPEGKYASPLRFVGGLTVGAACGWLAVVLASALFYTPQAGEIHAIGAALSVFLTGLVTWALDIEEPAAFSTALLTLFVYAQINNPELYVLSIAASSGIVALAFEGWRQLVYEQRARYLYESTRGDDHVLVPMRGEAAAQTAMLGARLAAAHRAGKVVLLDIVDDERVARAERSLLRDHDQTRLIAAETSGEYLDNQGRDALDSLGGGEAVSGAVSTLEARANRIETQVGVPCEVVVAANGGNTAQTVVQTAREANCDLVAAPYETHRGTVTQFVRDLFGSDVDVLVHRSTGERTRWRRILVPVRGPSGVATSMVDFATRLAAKTGQVSVATCINDSSERRAAEERLANLVETFEGNIETRVSQTSIETFLTRHDHEYDLILLGASQNRSAASRFISPPTFERIDSDAIDTDVAIIDRN
ncbi:HPP family protein [Salinibaculum rarum]|uniref:HPP family protein n=1 Tax=Salinibaculum rarum TaxID=3058903 RepID=UPI00265E70BB|nr:HPP family protein [Salinibaculum sp. KK48]